MAIFNSLQFDGIDSKDYGVYVSGESVYNAPARAVEMVSVPGKNGALVIDQGRYENIPVTYPIGLFGANQADFAEKIRQFRNELASRNGYRRLTDTYHPDEFRLGMFSSGLEVEPVQNNKAGLSDPIFDCKPQRFLVSGEDPQTIGEWGPTETETGEIVTFEAGDLTEIKNVSTTIVPVQDLHGYDKPWAPGNGKNKYSILIGADTATNNNEATHTNNNGVLEITPKVDTIATNSGVYLGSASTLSQTIASITDGGGTATVSFEAKASSLPTTLRYGASNSYTSATLTQDWQRFSYNRTSATNASIFYAVGLAQSSVISIRNVMVSADGSTNFAPYSNICPISGWTECDLSRTGINVWDEVWEVGGINVSTGQNDSATNRIRSKNYISCKPNTSYYLKTSMSTDDIMMFYYKTDNTFIGKSAWLYNGVFTTPNDCYYLRFVTGSAYGTTYNNDISINYPSTDTAYHAYNGNTYIIDLNGTRYGAHIDVTSGVMNVKKVLVDLGTLAWNRSTISADLGFRFFSDVINDIEPPSSGSVVADVISSQYKAYSQDEVVSGTTGIGVSTTKRIHIYDPNYTAYDTADFKTAMSGVQVVCELANPLTVQLTSTQIEAIKNSVNNLWSSTGEITVEYGDLVNAITNPTLYPSKPLLKITGVGTVTIGDQIITITGTASQVIYIDCETMEIYKIVGGVIENASSLVSFNSVNFPVLEPGKNNFLIGSGITEVVVTPRWWIL